MKPDSPIDDTAADEPDQDKAGSDAAGDDQPDTAGRARQGGRVVDRKLLEILVCPLTKTTLEYDAKAQELISRAAGLAYPIRNGIPIMLPEEARQLEES